MKKQHNKASFTLLCILLSASLQAWSASLSLVQLNPDIQISDLDISYTYNSQSSTFLAAGSLFSWFAYTAPDNSINNVSNGSYSLSASIDNSGSLLQGTLSITGGISNLGIADGSTLLSGNLIEFGYTNNSIDLFEFRVSILDGLLADAYGTQAGINMATEFGSSFDGDLSLSFSATAFADTFSAATPNNLSSVPVPGALWLFGSGLIALLRLARNRN